MKKTISIDLDGVLNTYHGNYQENKISPIKAGAKEFLQTLANDYTIEIYTVREKEIVNSWLAENELDVYISDVTNIKNKFSSVFIDDRAINFCGDYDKTIELIKKFKPYWK